MAQFSPSIQAPTPRQKTFTWVLSAPEIKQGLKNELIRERLMMHVAQVSHLNGYELFRLVKTNGDLVARGRWYNPKSCRVSVLWKPWKVLMVGDSKVPKRHRTRRTS